MVNKPLKIGITGGIGSGKSVVCQIFECLGAPVYYADNRAKWLMNHDDLLKEEIIRAFGQGAYKNTQLDRTFLSGQVFNDQLKLQKLNSLVHPAVGRDTQEWESRHSDQEYMLREAALFYEIGIDRSMDLMLVVAADLELRINRIMERDPHRSIDQVKAIINKQMPQEEKVNRADFVIWNNESSSLLDQVNEFLRGSGLGK